MPNDDEVKVVVYCKVCDCYVTILFSKQAVLEKGTFDGGLISGTFLHTPQDNDAHALILYFDKDFNHRGTVCSKIIESNDIYSMKTKK
ncbi:MAG: hypothetical protein ACFFCD_00080 [Promethearchaeota archaeon]